MEFCTQKVFKPWHKVYDELCAPATLVLGDTLLVIGSTHDKNFPLWMSTNPQKMNGKKLLIHSGPVHGIPDFCG